jgi:hypothetical protein
MDHLIAGISAFLISICTYFNGCHKVPQQITNSQTFKVKHAIYLTASQSSTLKAVQEQIKTESNMPKGEKPFFGEVISINKNSLVVQLPSLVNPNQKRGEAVVSKLTIKLNSSVQYSGGTFSDIQNGTKIAGIGKPASDGSITASRIEIKDSVPTK